MNDKVKFVPINSDDTPPDSDVESGSVEEAQKVTTLQREATEQAKLKQEELFYENNIKNVEDLKIKSEELEVKGSQLAKEIYDWGNKKSKEEADIQVRKAELANHESELNQREQDITIRESNVGVREQLLSERESLMSVIEKQKLDETEKYNSISEQLKRGFPQIISLMKRNANVLIRSGFNRFGDSLWDEIDTLEAWAKEGIDNHCKIIIEWLKGEVEDCNQMAVKMARDPKQYGEKWHNQIVDNLESMYKLLPILKPEYLPKDN